MVELKRYLFWTLVAGFAFAGGCTGGAGDPAAGTVQGRLTYRGEPVPEGTTVVLLGENGLAASGIVRKDGQFRIRLASSDRIPVGQYFVSVSPPPSRELTPEQAMQLIAEEREPIDEFPDIPRRYRNPDTSGETFAVGEGENVLDLDMRDDGT